MLGTHLHRSFDRRTTTPTYVDSAVASATSVTMPTHQKGDRLFGFAGRNDSGGITVPAGWTSIGSTSGLQVTVVLATKVAASASESSGTWTNADEVMVVSYRDVARVGLTAPDTSGGDYDSDIGDDTDSMRFEALSEVTGRQWVAAATWSNDTGYDNTTRPTGFTMRNSSNSSLGLSDSNGALASFSLESKDPGIDAFNGYFGVFVWVLEV